MTLAAVIPTKHHRNPNDVLAPGVIRAMKDDGTVDPAHDPRLSDAELVELYTAMVRVRILDDRLVALQRQGRIGFHIGSIGEGAAKLRPDDAAVIVYFGDGATSANDFHNGLNFAGVFKTPTIFFCRNNGWAISVPTERQTASASFAEKGIAYGVPSLRCDGNDLLAVISATREALARAVRGDGPTLIEGITYRLSGHSTSDDPQAYRQEGEVEEWRRRDPIARPRRLLQARGLFTDADQAKVEAQVQDEIKQAIAVAEGAPPPALATMFDDVYKEAPWHLREQCEYLMRSPRPMKR